MAISWARFSEKERGEGLFDSVKEFLEVEQEINALMSYSVRSLVRRS
jgi:hypothetical protein